MIELVDEKPIQKKCFFDPFPEGSRTWKVTCEICGKNRKVKRLVYDYGLGNMGFIRAEEAGFTTISYGSLNVRHMVICPDHKDSEIAPKIKELS